MDACEPALGGRSSSPDLAATRSHNRRASTSTLSRSNSSHMITVTNNHDDPRGPSVVVAPIAPRGTRTGELEEPLLGASSGEEPSSEQLFRNKLRLAYALSWAVNFFLLAAKLYAYFISHSKAVLASLVDSVVDIASQGVITWAEHEMSKEDPRFPVGRARLEALGVLACACIMSVSAFQVIQASAMDLYLGLAKGSLPELDVGVIMYLILGGASALKLLCYFFCAALRNRSDAMAALAEDHLNDIISNLAAVVTAALASQLPPAWWADPGGAVLISLYIAWRWADIAKAQVDKIVGRAAPEEFVAQLQQLAAEHHEQLEVDVIRAYHFGSRYLVEVEVVLPQSMSLAESHDISIELQHKVEALEQVERAFVHCDYQRRQEPEHKVERMLRLNSSSSH